jgi:glycosyltransferase involved in cell wall biosynthesis
VDVSTLLGWTGKYTGIPRTLSCLLSVWLQDERLRLRLCRFDDDFDVFCEVARPEVVELLAANAVSSPAPAEELEPVEPPPTLLTPLKRAYARLPWHLQEAGRSARSTVLHLIYYMLDLGRSARRVVLHAGRPEPAVAPPACPFAQGDVLLIAGAGWDEEHFCETLGRVKWSGVRLVTLFYDFIALKYPQFFLWFMPPRVEAWAHEMLRMSDLVLTISENSRRDIVSVDRQNCSRLPPVKVIRLGDELPIEEKAIRPADLPPDWDEDQPFVLVAGTVEVRKNHYLLYQVWRRLIEQHGEDIPPLIFAGRAGWLTAELLQQIRHDPLIRGRLLHLADVTDLELRWLYQHCRFTLYPSHYEGWGLPVAESLAHGKYCISSCTSSLPEIAGDLIDYYDPLDVAGCLQLVERALFEKGFLQQREARIHKEYRVTRWVDCAASVMEHMRAHLPHCSLRDDRDGAAMAS